VLLADLAFYKIILLIVTAIHAIVVFFTDLETHGTAMVTASVMLMEILKVTVTRGNVVSPADLIFAQICQPNAPVFARASKQSQYINQYSVQPTCNYGLLHDY
jgi:hypothetical protein